jgi:hypothetical protein
VSTVESVVDVDAGDDPNLARTDEDEELSLNRRERCHLATTSSDELAADGGGDPKPACGARSAD